MKKPSPGAVLSAFQQKVLSALLLVPYGKVTTYGKIARSLGDPRLSRAVGNALHFNPDGEKYPCYKVVSGKGKLSDNYAFGGKEAQKKRLESEGIEVSEDGSVDLEKYGV